MRALAPVLLALIGIFASLLVGRLRSGAQAPWLVLAGVGVVGAFAGLWIRDALDIQALGPLGGAIVAAALGGALLALVVSAVLRRS